MIEGFRVGHYSDLEAVTGCTVILAPAEGAIGGVGLGLAICRAIVRLHGGEIWAERRIPAGAAFRFTLPLEESPAMPDEPL